MFTFTITTAYEVGNCINFENVFVGLKNVFWILKLSPVDQSR